MTDAVAPPPPPAKPNPFVGPAIVAVWIALGALILSHPSGVAVFAFVMLGWILAVMLHEFSHAAVAFLGGDHTVKTKGYLAFDPRRYGDVGVSLVMPVIFLLLGGIGFPGGAVYLRNDLMRGRLWRSAASFAGPTATFLVLAAISAGLFAWASFGVSGPGRIALFEAFTLLGFLQATALILNLLPIPGLDGFNILRPWLPSAWTANLRKVEGLVMIGLLLVIFYLPGASQQLFDAAAQLSAAMGLDIDALRGGWSLFHFWRR